jgi:SCAN domain-containing zinc finger protein
MALNPRNSFQCQPFPNDLAPGSQEPNQSHGSAVRKEEEISEFSSIQLTSFQHNNSCVRQELRRLYEVFHSCLQPEKHTKEEIISQLVLEQFIISGYCKDKSTLKEKWESSGRNLEKLMEDLTDDCIKPPVLVHVHLQGQEALFSENMPLKEVIIHLKQLAETSSEECMGTSSQTQNTPLETDESGESAHHRGVLCEPLPVHSFIK